MAKHYKRKRINEKAFTWLFCVLLAALVIAIVVALVLPQTDGTYVITDDGHVHDGSGNHLGDLYEMVESGQLTLTADGHIHDPNGNHIGDVTQMLDGAEAGSVTEDATQETPTKESLVNVLPNE